MIGDSSSVYERWVRALRDWGQDPTTDLSGLPPIDERSFPPATYRRFLTHLNSAVDAFMRTWQTAFAASMAEARDDHGRARSLTAARRGLSRRLQLAQHPALPAPIRDQLLEQATNDIRGLQAQLESQSQSGASALGLSGRSQRDATLKLVRDNALTAVLDPGYTPVGSVDDSELQRAERAAQEILAAQAERGAPTGAVGDYAPQRPRRRIVGEDFQS